MNERIKELWNQVDTIQWCKVYGEWYIPYIPLQIYGEPTRFEITDIHLEKFAELIVAECMKLNCKELSITAIERLLPLYKEHFGVEE